MRTFPYSKEGDDLCMHLPAVPFYFHMHFHFTRIIIVFTFNMANAGAALAFIAVIAAIGFNFSLHKIEEGDRRTFETLTSFTFALLLLCISSLFTNLSNFNNWYDNVHSTSTKL